MLWWFRKASVMVLLWQALRRCCGGACPVGYEELRVCECECACACVNVLPRLPCRIYKSDEKSKPKSNADLTCQPARCLPVYCGSCCSSFTPTRPSWLTGRNCFLFAADVGLPSFDLPPCHQVALWWPWLSMVRVICSVCVGVIMYKMLFQGFAGLACCVVTSFMGNPVGVIMYKTLFQGLWGLRAVSWPASWGIPSEVLQQADA